MDQGYPQTPHFPTATTHVSLPHTLNKQTLLKLFIPVNDCPIEVYCSIGYSEAKQLNVAQAFIEHLLCFQAHVDHQERHRGRHGPCIDHNLMSNDITASKEALSKKVQELPCTSRSMLYI